MRLKNFRVFLRARFNRDLDKTRKKHIRAYLTEKGKTAALRPILCVIKSCFKHLHKRNVIAKDVSIGFKLGRQNPCRTERNLKTSDIRRMFALAQKKNSPVSHAILQCLTYAGIRITALSKLRRDSVIKTSMEKDGVSIDKYFLRIDNAKGNKHRKVMLKTSIGRSLYCYAASLSGEWLFPSNRKGFEGKSMHPQAISQRIKRLAKAIKQPMISCHWFRHHYATHALAQGASIIDVSKSMGHSNVSITVSRDW
jgi:integrase/recombinase XerC